VDSSEIRRSFLEFFRERGHQVVPSSSLVPANDPTLLFANSGMVQFKDMFLGVENRGYSRAATAQKCVRAGGKHNDLENVGPSLRHQTFFEMLGNFSFGDYFKRESLTWGWELLTQVYKIDPTRLRPTVFEEDDEAVELWMEISGLPQSQIIRLGKKTNFWEVGDTGPCGPNSEIFFDKYPERGHADPSTWEIEDEDRWVEIWNHVFTQFDRQKDGSYVPLPRKNVDTGMGLERVAMVLQGVDSNYETDLFVPLLEHIRDLAGSSAADLASNPVPYRVVADHARAMTFLIADGVTPGGAERSYVLRKIMRRAIRFGRQLGFDGPFLGKVADQVIEMMGGHYHEIVTNQRVIQKVILSEETLYKRTIESAFSRFAEAAGRLKAAGEHAFPGNEAFRLYGTYGLSLDLLGELAREHELELDEPGFERALAEDRTQRNAAVVTADKKVNYAQQFNLPATEFLGYETLESEAVVQAILRHGEVLASIVPTTTGETLASPSPLIGDGGGGMAEPDLNTPPHEQPALLIEYEVVTDRTPFYAERGGQVGDRGYLYGADGTTFVVLDTQRRGGDVYVHRGSLLSGKLAVGDHVQASVPEQRRRDVMRNHSATHLIHQAFRDVLGPHLYQRGSLVEADYLRFDFNHYAAVLPEELREVERQVNQHIRSNHPVTVKYCTFEEAIADGAIALFNEKYGATVREVQMESYSRELCGGAHCGHTGEVGFLRIISEQSIGSGLRRVVAVTGRGAEEYIQAQLATLEQVANSLQTRPERLLAQAEQIAAQVRTQERKIGELERKLATSGGSGSGLLDQVQEVSGIKVLAARVEASSDDALRELGDFARSKLGSAVIALGTVLDGKPRLLLMATDDLVGRGIHAGNIVKEITPLVGGKGGGRPQMAMGGGSEAEGLDAALQQVGTIVAAQLK